MPDPEDALIEAQVERALAPYRSMVTPEALEAMREVLTDVLATHPVAVRLLARLRERATVQVSGPVGLDDAVGESASDRKTGTGELP